MGQIFPSGSLCGGKKKDFRIHSAFKVYCGFCVTVSVTSENEGVV